MIDVLFIHGMFVTPLCWRGWSERFSARGWSCAAPAWPYHDGEASVLRARHPDPALGNLTLGDVVAQFESIVRGYAEPPVLVGHSLGGLVVQRLLNLGLGARGVAIDSAPPKGVFVVSGSMLKSNWPLFFGTRPFLMSEEQFRYAFAHTLPDDQLRVAYERHVVPESRVLGRGALGRDGALDWKKPHAPLLLVAGGADKIIPPAVNRSNRGKYAHDGSRVDFHEFAGRTHYTILDGPGWTEVADFVADWIAR